MQPIRHFLSSASAALLLCIPALPACSPVSEPEPESQAASAKKDTEPGQLVGRIASVSADRSYVVIQAYGVWSVPANTILASTGSDGRSANIKVTGENIKQFAAGDIQSGTVETGDAVFSTIKNQSSAPRTQSQGPPSTPFIPQGF